MGFENKDYRHKETLQAETLRSLWAKGDFGLEMNSARKLLQSGWIHIHGLKKKTSQREEDSEDIYISEANGRKVHYPLSESESESSLVSLDLLKSMQVGGSMCR